MPPSCRPRARSSPQILEAEGQRQSAILQAEGDAKAQVLRAEGEAQAIATVFEAIHVGDPDEKLLSYQYLQMLPKIAEGTANKLWMIPSEFTEALSGIAKGFTAARTGADPPPAPPRAADFLDKISKLANESLANTASAVPHCIGSRVRTPPRRTSSPTPTLDERLAESNRSVEEKLAAADDETDAAVVPTLREARPADPNGRSPTTPPASGHGRLRRR